jgi:AsmA-like protein
VGLLMAIAPFVNAAAFGPAVRRALETSLGRKVDFEKIYFSLFPVPGFSLESVTIHEDPRYGLEPFAHASGLEVRLRADKLLLGQMRLSTLRLVEPSLNLVKRGDGTWNVVDLVQRLSAPRRMPLSLFPAIEVLNGRIDFKLGTRKTTLYIAGSDLSVYPERSGRVIVRFSGSPARTDRAGNGFGHVRGTLNWRLNPAANGDQLDADVNLDPSNLSEITALIEGHDIGIHGTVSANAHLEGPLAALSIGGDLRLEDVHRWDLLPSSGDFWKVAYQGKADLVTHHFAVRTLPPSTGEVVPLALEVRINEFLTRPAWSILATLHKAPIQPLLPLGKRMGLALPAGLEMNGALNGVVGYSNSSGVEGGIAITNAVAVLPGIPALRSAVATVRVSGGNIHIDPAILEAGVGGTLRAGGDFNLSSQHLSASLSVDEFPVQALKTTAQTWFGAPAALASLTDGYITGQFLYSTEQRADHDSKPAAWSGQFQFSNATLAPPGIAVPLKQAEGRAQFGASTFDLAHFSATLGGEPVFGSYRYNLSAKRPERLHLEIPSVNLAQLETALGPVLEDRGLLARLPFTRRSTPAFIAARNLEGDIVIDRLSVDRAELGPLMARFLWQGANLQFTALELNLPEGVLKAFGSVNLSSYSPRSTFVAHASGLPWGGGLLRATGQIRTSGIGSESLANLRATGSFSAGDVTLPVAGSFSKVSGAFALSFSSGWPDLRLSKLQASQDDEDWSGEAASRGDGKLIFDLEHDGRPLRVVSDLMPQTPAPSPPLASQAVPQ